MLEKAQAILQLIREVPEMFSEINAVNNLPWKRYENFNCKNITGSKGKKRFPAKDECFFMEKTQAFHIKKYPNHCGETQVQVVQGNEITTTIKMKTIVCPQSHKVSRQHHRIQNIR